MQTPLRPALMSVLAFTFLTGLVFPGIVTVLATRAFPYQAHGSLVERDGQVIGSALIGQMFAKPEYFHPRPSAAGSGYDAGASSGTNLGPTSDKLLHGIQDLAAAYRAENGLAAEAPVPADAVTRSASGLDPHISPENAHLQAARVAKARGRGREEVGALIAAQTQSRTFGVLGEPRVNVLALNRALEARR